MAKTTIEKSLEVATWANNAHELSIKRDVERKMKQMQRKEAIIEILMNTLFIGSLVAIAVWALCY